MYEKKVAYPKPPFSMNELKKLALEKENKIYFLDSQTIEILNNLFDEYFVISPETDYKTIVEKAIELDAEKINRKIRAEKILYIAILNNPEKMIERYKYIAQKKEIYEYSELEEKYIFLVKEDAKKYKSLIKENGKYITRQAKQIEQNGLIIDRIDLVKFKNIELTTELLNEISNLLTEDGLAFASWYIESQKWNSFFGTKTDCTVESLINKIDNCQNTKKVY